MSAPTRLAKAPRAPVAEQAQVTEVHDSVRELSRSRRLWSLLPVAVLSGAAGYGFARVFPPSELLPVLVVAVLVPTVLSGLLGARPGTGGAGRRTPALWPSAVLTVVAWAVAVSATLFRGTNGGLPGGPALRAAWSSLLDAPHVLLSVVLPAPGDPELLVLPHAVVWTAAFASAELALRTRAPLLPALPPLLAFGFPLVLGADGTGPSYPAVGVLAGATALLVLLRSRTRLPLRALALRLPLVAALALVAALLGPRLPGVGAPHDLREAVTPPTTRPESVSPLDQVAAWTRNADDKVFTVRTSGAAAPGNYRLAVLDTYDGTTWTSSAELLRSGGRVPAEAGVEPGRTKEVRQRVTVQSLPGIWLPVADRPSQVDAPAGTSLSVDPDSAVLSTGRAVPSGFTYTATSHVPEPDARRLRSASAADDPTLVALPDVDAAGRPIPAVRSFRKLAEQATAGAGSPYERAARLAQWLRQNHRFDPDAVPGHTYRSLEFFLTEGGHGTSEQFAASFAVLARTLGLPTRVAVGFGPGTRTGPGAWQVQGRDVLAWPEVRFADVGWVRFDPTPREATPGSTDVPEGGEKAAEKITEGTRPSTRPRTTDPATGAPAAASPATPALPVPVGVVAALALLLLLATAYVLYALRAPRTGSRRLRDDPDSRRRLLGAWQRITERLTEIGLPATGTRTAEEIAAFGARHMDATTGRRLTALAALVNEVHYAGRDPDSTAADAAWADCDAIERALRRHVPYRTRLLLHLRSTAPGRMLADRAGRHS
ncbi:DUF3488 and transglutaminase-like domain-containing protein [Streptomyces sp. S.PB5]|uniref:DUF3488 and transglutaminase-like domain-containing protein n=1 Tax=Streptomyces sp. S.PB5 TaxID=3020844 RepID=UPI0025B23350|nr:DUF3488 and transglutaminase-like domain-containing protein [Streptomyces sp. S.PB5]MDN3023978.1 DUF3488 and transglutaminase-like domain-containing protein [Streptomyces sp. S.PB5]